MTSPRYHISPNGPRLCSASIRSCPYGADNHFDDKHVARQTFIAGKKTSEQIFRETSNKDKTLTLGGSQEQVNALVESADWGAAIADLIDAHMEKTNVKPEQIPFTFRWEEESLSGNPEDARCFVFDATPRLDDSLGKFTNVYRVAWWTKSDYESEQAITAVYRTESGRDQKWATIPEQMKWEVAFGEELPEVNLKRNDWAEQSQKLRNITELNEASGLAVLNTPNKVDFDELVNKLRNNKEKGFASALDVKSSKGKAFTKDEMLKYEEGIKRKAANIIKAIQATENTLIGPYNAYEKGIGFYHLDNDRRVIIDEELSTTFVRGRNLHELGLDSQRWLTGTGAQDRGRNVTDFEKKQRALRSVNKGVPYESPMVFWTAETPDGARWELGLDIASKESGPNRVRYFDAANPNVPTECAFPKDSVEGFQAMKEAMEQRYGESSSWSAKLQRDMQVLSGIAEGHETMLFSAKSSRDRLGNTVTKITVNQTADEEHKALFGDFGKLFA